MANRNNRRMDYNRANGLLPRPMQQVSPWQQNNQGMQLANMLPLGNSSEATLVLANNLINNLLQSRQNTVPSLLDVPVQRNFPNQDFNRGISRMGNQPNFRRGPGNFSSPGNRNNKNFRPLEANKRQPYNQRRDDPKFKNKQSSTPKKTFTPKESETKTGTQKPESKELKDGNDDVAMETTEGDDTADQGASEGAKAGDDKEKKSGDSKGDHKTAYDGIAAALLHCHICNKGMWDGRSFDNHINGRAHHMMMDKTAESYALTADTIRQELKINEMKTNRRMGRAVQKKFYCPMCDLYATDGASHRNSIGHRKLKKFLHPGCTVCNKEMATRIDLDEHKLSVEHLTTMQSKKGTTVVKLRPQNMTIATLAEEEGYVRSENRGRKRDNKSEIIDGEKQTEGGESQSEGAEKKPEGEEDKEAAEEDVILDVKEGQDVSELADKKMPTYSTTRGVGQSFVSELRIFECRLCNKFLDTAETAEVHLRTWRHHTLFNKHLHKLLGGKKDEAKQEVKPEPEEGPTEAKRRRIDDGDQDGENGDDNGDENEPAAEEDDTMDESVEGKPEESKGAAASAGPGAGTEAEADVAEEEWEKDLGQLISDIPDVLGDEEKPAVEEKPKATPSKRGRGRGRGRGVRR